MEGEAELEVLSKWLWQKAPPHPSASASIRTLDPKTHPYISTGLRGNKFGVAHERTLAAYQRAAALPGLQVVGIDFHIGSQITEVTPLPGCHRPTARSGRADRATGIPIHHIDFGGGLGINYNGDTPPAADVLWQQLFARIDARGFGGRQFMIEPGRSLCWQCGFVRYRSSVSSLGRRRTSASSTQP